MQATSDTELLQQYAAYGSEPAFAALVTRYVNLVHSAAARTTGNSQAAEEITQAVFIILARKAGELRREIILSGWLYQTARLTAANFLRGEIRRVDREREAFMQTSLNEDNSNAWPAIAPLLEHAMGRLNEKERNAVLLRFFEGKSFEEVGSAFGGSENAAKKRVFRGLEKLRKFFARQGVHSTTGAISAAISANSIQVAPAALAQTLTAVAVAKGATASASTLTLIQGALKLMAWTKAKTTIVAGACVLLTAAAMTTVIVQTGEKPIHGFPSGWSVLNGSGQWNTARGRILAHSTTGDAILASGDEYTNFTFSAVVSTVNREASLALRLKDENNGYLIVFAPAGRPSDSGPAPGYVSIVRRTGGNETTLATYKKRKMPGVGQATKIKAVAAGPAIEVAMNGETILQATDTTFASGYIGFRVYGWEDFPCDATFSDVTFH